MLNFQSYERCFGQRKPNKEWGQENRGEGVGAQFTVSNFIFHFSYQHFLDYECARLEERPEKKNEPMEDGEFESFRKQREWETEQYFNNYFLKMEKTVSIVKVFECLIAIFLD